MKSASETKRKFFARRSGRDSKNTRGAFSPSFPTYSDSCPCQASQQIFHGQASSTATLGCAEMFGSKQSAQAAVPGLRGRRYTAFCGTTEIVSGKAVP